MGCLNRFRVEHLPSSHYRNDSTSRQAERDRRATDEKAVMQSIVYVSTRPAHDRTGEINFRLSAAVRGYGSLARRVIATVELSFNFFLILDPGATAALRARQRATYAH